MPAYIVPLVGFSIGVLFSWAAGEELTRAAGSLGSTRSLAVVVLFSFLIFGPMSGYFLAYATDWSLAYLLDGRHLPSAVMLVAVLLNIAVVPLGFAAGAAQVRRRRLMALLPMGAVPLAVAAVVVGVLARRLSFYGTYAQVHRGGSADPLPGSPVGQAVLWFLLCLLAGVAWTTRELRLLSLASRRG